MLSKLRISDNGGYILPMILTISIATIIILTILVSRFVISTDISHNSYYTRIAKEAAQAGIVYANACYSDSELTQTWGAVAGRPNLAPNTDCTGMPITGKSQYLIDSDVIKTTFEVGDIDKTDSSGLQITARGYVEYVDNLGNTVHVTSAAVKRVSWLDSAQVNPTGFSVDMGRSTSCAVVSGAAYCWGSNSYGGLGIGSNTPSSTTVPMKVLQEKDVLKGRSVSKVAIGEFTLCAITEDGKLFCWGYAIGSTAGANKPIQVKGLLEGKFVTDVSVGDSNICAIASGKIYCWGVDSYGVLGNGSGLGTYGTNEAMPTIVTDTYLPSDYQAVKLATTGGITTQMCAIMDSGKLYCWGGNRLSELGLNVGLTHSSSYWSSTYMTVSAPYPVYSNGLLNGSYLASSVATNGSTQNASNISCAVGSGQPFCTSNDRYYGHLYPMGKFYLLSGPFVAPMTKVVVGGQGEQVCGMASDALYCWNGNNSVGTAMPVTMNKIASISGFSTTDVIDISTYWNDFCAIFKDGHTYCWTGITGSGGNPYEVQQVYNLVHGVYF